MSLTRRLTIITTFIICTLCLSDSVFAAWNDTMLTKDIVDVLNIILQLLSWLRIPFASIAGALMTNTMVYGDFLNLGKVLRLIWGISQTFANFVAVAVFMYTIVTSIIEKDLDFSKISKTILGLIKGIILANMSFFLIGALIDVSTVATIAVWSFPSTYMSTMPQLREEIITNIKSVNNKKMSIDLSKERDSGNMITHDDGKVNTMTEDEIMDTIMPRENSMSWPLIYIGAYVLKASNLSSIDAQTSTSDILLLLLTRVWIILLFTVALIMLIAINLYRIISIRFLICLAPLLAVMQSGDRMWKGEELAWSILENFSVENVIKIIFAPVVSTALIGILLILVVTMDSVIQSNNISINDTISVKQESNGASTIAGMNMFSTTIEWDLFGDSNNGDRVKNVFSDLLMFAITIGLLRGMIWGISKYSEPGIWGAAIGKMKDLSSQLLGSIPIIPIGGGKSIGTSSAYKWWRDKISEIKDTIDIKNKWSEGLDKLENSLRSTVWLEQVMPARERQYFNTFTNKAQRGNFIYNSEWLQEYRKVLKNTKLEQYHKDNPSISIGKINTTLWNSIQSYLQAVADNKEYQRSRWTKPINLSQWEKDDTVQTYIDRNYKVKKGNEEFFESLYEDIWWDREKLKEAKSGKSPGSFFWDEKVRRKKQENTL